MKKRFTFLLFFLLAAFIGLQQKLLAQTTTITTETGTNYDGSNSSTGNVVLTFAIENTNTYPIRLTGLDYFWKTGYNGAIPTLWYSGTSIYGPAAVAAPAWTSIATGSAITVTANGYTPIFTNLNFIIPADTILRFALQSTNGIGYSGNGSTLLPTPSIFSNSGVNLKVHDVNVAGQYIGNVGTFPNASTSPRAFTGRIHFEPTVPCVTPPNAGQAVSSVTQVCPNTTFKLSLTGATGGMGMTYQWQSSTNGTTGWTNIASATASQLNTTQTATTWYRAVTTCSGQSANSQPVQVPTNTAPVSGTFTINKGAPASASNFQSFTAAIASIQCGGVNGAVTFNVVANSGPYVEAVSIPVIPGASATNTITFNGNGNTLEGVNTTLTPTLKLDGADYIRVNNLTLKSEPNANAGHVVNLLNGADNNIFTGNTISHSITGTTTNNSYAVYLQTGSSYNSFQNNTIIGAYNGIYNTGGAATTLNTNNSFVNNTIKDYFNIGILNQHNIGTIIERNDISRPTRTNSTIVYGIHLSTNTTGVTVSKNRIHNTYDAATTTTGSTTYGIYAISAGTVGSENIIKNNAFYNINAPGSIFYAFYNSAASNTYYYHNTVAADAATITYNTLRGIHLTGAVTNVKFMNNIISFGSPATNKHAIYVNSTTTVSLQSNNNDLYAPTGNVGYFGAAMATLTDWKAANSGAYDQNSVSVDPLLVAPATGNLQPVAAGVNNIGQPLTAVTDDILGNPRSATTPDPGAVEFSLNTNDAGITAISGPVTGCGLTAAETITATIKNYGTATLTSIPVTLSVNGTPLAGMPETWTGSLAPNATATYIFTAKADLSAAGLYKIVAATALNSDNNNNNNTDTLKVTNALMAGLPVMNFETATSGISAMRLVTNSKSAISEDVAASLPLAGAPATSTKGMLMEGSNATGWVIPAATIDPWTTNPDYLSGAYMCFAPQGATNPGTPLWLAFDLKQTFKGANANTNFRVTINGVQVGPTYRPPFSGTPIDWQKVYIDLTPYKNQATIQIGLESSVSEPYANGAGPANLIDNLRVVRFDPSGVKDKLFQSSINVYPNPSNGKFMVTVPTLSSTVGSEAWNSRDLKSRPH